MITIFNTLVSEPLYSGLIFLINKMPFFDVGVVIIIFTILIKIILLPLSIKASKSQLQMKGAEKDINLIKEKYKDKPEQGLKIMESYKEKGINPFVSILIIFIQIPILIGLYRVFLGLPQINKDWLYGFIEVPSSVNMVFLGFIDMSEKSIILALLVGLTTFLQTSLATSPVDNSVSGNNTQSTAGDFAKAMSFQMKYFLPPLIAIIIYNISSAVALYLFVSNIFSIVQEYYIKQKYHKSITVV